MVENTPYRLDDFKGDLVMVGVGMDAERYIEIKATLPAETQENLIGWKKIVAQ